MFYMPQFSKTLSEFIEAVIKAECPQIKRVICDCVVIAAVKVDTLIVDEGGIVAEIVKRVRD